MRLAKLLAGVSALAVRSPEPRLYFGPPYWDWNPQWDYERCYANWKKAVR